jgi:hypothetical protein
MSLLLRQSAIVAIEISNLISPAYPDFYQITIGRPKPVRIQKAASSLISI